MLAYTVRRVLQAFLTLILVSFIIYGLIRAMPGSPIDTDPAMMSPDQTIGRETRELLKEQWGLDKDWYVAYFTHFVKPLVFDGDFGKSSDTKRPVVDEIGRRVWPTMLLSITSLLLTYLLSIPLGLFASARAGKADERTVSVLLYMLYSLPGFVAALYLQLYVSLRLGWLPLSGWSDAPTDATTAEVAWDVTKHAILPVVVYTYSSLAYYTRFIRANMQETMRQDFIRTAQAKGLPRHKVVMKHAFRNTLIPLVTLIGLTLPSLLSGSVIIEQIFNWPGMGRLFFESIGKRDYNVIMALTLMFSVLTLAGQLIADLLYAVVDPRVRLG